MLLRKEFVFDAAHNLVSYHGKCEKLHGHTYRMAITLRGVPDDEGMIFDFVKLKRVVQEKVLVCLDHSYLNDIVPQPTAENIARWVWLQLVSELTGPNFELHEIQIWETSTSSVILHKEDV